MQEHLYIKQAAVDLADYSNLAHQPVPSHCSLAISAYHGIMILA